MRNNIIDSSGDLGTAPKSSKRSDKILFGTLKFWTLFIGVGAVGGAIMLWCDPDGSATGLEQALVLLREKIPFGELLFRNLILSGFVLLAVNGITQFTAAYLLFRKHRLAPHAVLACGIILMLWTALEWYVWGSNFLSNIYFIFGLIEAATAVAILCRNSASASNKIDKVGNNEN